MTKELTQDELDALDHSGSDEIRSLICEVRLFRAANGKGRSVKINDNLVIRETFGAPVLSINCAEFELPMDRRDLNALISACNTAIGWMS